MAWKILVFTVLVILNINVTKCNLECEDLSIEDCAFAVASSGARCVLQQVGDKVKCQTSMIMAERKLEWIEDNECVKACGVDRNAVGMSTDALLQKSFRQKLCSPACQYSCYNIFDLYVKLAAGEGFYLPSICQGKKLTSNRKIKVDPTPLTKPAGDATSAPAPSPAAQPPVPLAPAVQPPVGAPTQAPAQSIVEAPGQSFAETPGQAPSDQPTAEAPVEGPAEAPVEVEAPVEGGPAETPVEAPVEVEAPVQGGPAETPVEAPVEGGPAEAPVEGGPAAAPAILSFVVEAPEYANEVPIPSPDEAYTSIAPEAAAAETPEFAPQYAEAPEYTGEAPEYAEAPQEYIESSGYENAFENAEAPGYDEASEYPPVSPENSPEYGEAPVATPVSDEFSAAAPELSTAGPATSPAGTPEAVEAPQLATPSDYSKSPSETPAETPGWEP